MQSETPTKWQIFNVWIVLLTKQRLESDLNVKDILMNNSITNLEYFMI